MSRYASDELVRQIQNAGRSISRAHYVFSEEEADTDATFSSIVRDTNAILTMLTASLAIKGQVSFAVVASASPYQVCYLGADQFVVLIAFPAHHALAALVCRLAAVSPISEEFGAEPVPSEKEYDGKYLLDVAKDFTFHTPDLTPYLTAHARGLLQISAAFIFGHELAHVTHGHLEFRCSPQFRDMHVNDDDINLTKRTLEMDADSAGTAYTIDVIRFTHASAVAQGIKPDHITSEEFERSAWKQCVLGMYIALIHLEALASNYTPVAYPVGYARFLTVQHVSEIIFQRWGTNFEDIPEAMRQLLVAAFGKLSGGIQFLHHPIASNVILIEDDGVPQYLYNALGVASGVAHIEPLLGRWARIRPELEKYMRGGRLAPADAPPI